MKFTYRWNSLTDDALDANEKCHNKKIKNRSVDCTCEYFGFYVPKQILQVIMAIWLFTILFLFSRILTVNLMTQNLRKHSFFPRFVFTANGAFCPWPASCPRPCPWTDWAGIRWREHHCPVGACASAASCHPCEMNASCFCVQTMWFVWLNVSLFCL